MRPQDRGPAGCGAPGQGGPQVRETRHVPQRGATGSHGRRYSIRT
jgi:hypothetical protein